MTHFVIGLNGPAGSGKGWLIPRITEALYTHGVKTVSVFRVNTAIFESMIDHGIVKDRMTDYEWYKRQPGGRDRIIEHSLSERARDPDIFSRRVLHDLRIVNPTVAIIDNIGLIEELEFFKRELESPYDNVPFGVLNIRERWAVEPPSPWTGIPGDKLPATFRNYADVKIGEQYPGDCRYRVYHHNGMTYRTSADALKGIKEILKYVEQFKSPRSVSFENGIQHLIARTEQVNRFGTREWIKALMGVCYPIS